jgi:ribosomal subunit interface protein
MSPINIEVTARGEVSDRARDEARRKLGELEGFSKGPILGARVVLIQEANPRIAMPARAEAELDLQGRVVRARAAAPSMEAAVDDVAERLQRHLRRYVERLLTREREPAQPPPGEWSHRSWSPPRPPTFVRPVEEREIIRRKSFAFGPMSVDEAADALEDLDHEFFLFHDAETDADAVVYWRDDGLLALIEPRWAASADDYGPVRDRNRFSSPIDLLTAVEEMNAVAHRFLFFENATTGRGNVIYRRYDGHYGLIEPA